MLIVPKSGNAEAESAASKVRVPVTIGVVDEIGDVYIHSKTGCTIIEGEISETRAIPQDTALFLHTSGTTGLPKGVPLSHKNMITTMRNIVATYNLTSSDRGYVVMPLFHVHGLMAGLFGALYSTGSIVLPSNGAGFQASLLWNDIATYKCTWFTAVPTMHQVISKCVLVELILF
jgi:acyl-CoA synthetase (AMP-forming)/AMP-acid ligase II